MRQLGDAGLRLIKNFEGCRLTAYKPVSTETYWTIGWGHYGPDVKQGQTITQAEADAMLLRDLERYVSYTNDVNNVTIIDKLTQNQFDALVSFCYNCGPGNLRDLCKGKRTPEAIAEDLPKYNKGGGKVLAGLVRRRATELELFNTPDPETEDEDMAKIAELEQTIQEQAERIAALEKRVNMSGNQTPPEWSHVALAAAKAAGAITTTNDKGTAEIIMIQMLYNMGMFNPGAVALIKNAQKEG